MDRLEAMLVFAAIVDAGSLSAAGRKLDVPLATISRKLSDLESLLKARLLTRSTRRLELTDAGRDYLAACRQILEQVDEAERIASGAYANARGAVAVAAPIGLWRLILAVSCAAHCRRPCHHHAHARDEQTDSRCHCGSPGESAAAGDDLSVGSCQSAGAK